MLVGMLQRPRAYLRDPSAHDKLWFGTKNVVTAFTCLFLAVDEDEVHSTD